MSFGKCAKITEERKRIVETKNIKLGKYTEERLPQKNQKRARKRVDK